MFSEKSPPQKLANATTGAWGPTSKELSSYHPAFCPEGRWLVVARCNGVFRRDPWQTPTVDSGGGERGVRPPRTAGIPRSWCGRCSRWRGRRRRPSSSSTRSTASAASAVLGSKGRGPSKYLHALTESGQPLVRWLLFFFHLYGNGCIQSLLHTE